MEFEVEAYHNAFWGFTNGKFLSWVDEDDCIEIKETKFTGRKLGKLRDGSYIEIDFDNNYYYFSYSKFKFNLFYRDDLKRHNREQYDLDIIELYDLIWREDTSAVSKQDEILQEIDRKLEEIKKLQGELRNDI